MAATRALRTFWVPLHFLSRCPGAPQACLNPRAGHSWLPASPCLPGARVRHLGAPGRRVRTDESVLAMEISELAKLETLFHALLDIPGGPEREAAAIRLSGGDMDLARR